MAWKDCQQYMRLIHELRDELSREIDIVQVNGEPREETFLAIRRAVAARREYRSSLEEKYGQ